MGQLMIGGHSGARLKYNLFVQPDEPDVKNGLWIQSPAPVAVSDVLLKDNYSVAGHYATGDDYTLPTYRIPDLVALNGGRFDLANPNSCFLKSPTELYLLFQGGDQEWAIFLINPATGKISLLERGTRSDYYTYFLLGEYLCRYKPDYYAYVIKNYITGSTSGVPVNAISSSSGTQLAPLAALNGDYYSIISNGASLCHYVGATNTRAAAALGMTVAFYVDTGVTGDYTTNNTCVIGDFLYLYSGAYASAGKIYRINLPAGTIEVITDITLTGSYKCCVAEGVPYFFDSSGVYRVDIETSTFTKLDETASVFDIVTTVPGYGIIGLAGANVEIPTGSNSFYAALSAKQLLLIHESEKNNTLCLLAGGHVAFLIVNTDKAKKTLPKISADIIGSSYYHAPSTDFSIDDAWYYDTDFREYPTFIGNGSTWTKIKN